MTLPTVAKRPTAAAVTLALLAGCASSGLSPRETGRQNYSSFVYSLYDFQALPAGAGDDAAERAGDAPQPPPKLVLPARVAVAQVGEMAPPQAFLDKLRKRPELFSRVETISGFAGSYGMRDEAPPPPPESQTYYINNSYAAGPPAPAVPAETARTANASPQEQVRLDVARMRRMAGGMGMDHLLVLGGTIDHETHGNNLAILDLTIVGAFVVPSKEINAKATAAAALIDLRTGRVVLTASADASKGGLASTATQEGGELNVLRQARDEVVDKLADSVVAQCQNSRT